MTRLTTCTPSKMSCQAFVAHFKDLYEHSPWVAQKVFDLGMSSDLDHQEALLPVFQKVMLDATKDQQLALICAHPDLAGKAAIRGELTAASTSEQSGAGISECTAAEFERFYTVK